VLSGWAGIVVFATADTAEVMGYDIFGVDELATDLQAVIAG